MRSLRTRLILVPQRTAPQGDGGVQVQSWDVFHEEWWWNKLWMRKSVKSTWPRDQPEILQNQMPYPTMISKVCLWVKVVMTWGIQSKYILLSLYYKSCKVQTSKIPPECRKSICWNLAAKMTWRGSKFLDILPHYKVVFLTDCFVCSH